MSIADQRRTKAATKYLAQHAADEVHDLDQLDGLDGTAKGRPLGHVIVIPARGEGQSLITALRSVPTGPYGSVLVIVIVNATEDAPADVHAANQISCENVSAAFAVHSRSGVLSLHDHPAGALLLVDRQAPGRRMPAGHGVGHARKLGADLAFAMIVAGQIEAPLIHCTDADARLPADTFAAVPRLREDVSAALYRFWHEPTPDVPLLRRASGAYEIKLRYHVLGLRAARSPYAFHTIGSTVAIGARAYAEVRGFPQREAAEDFYLLNKLAKVGRVVELDGAPIALAGRVSHRVPFGTGRSLSDLTQSATTPYRLYHPDVYAHLGDLLSAFGSVATEPRPLRDAVSNRPVVDALAALGLFESLDREVQRGRNRNARLRNLHTFFDGFRTLKLIHRLRDDGLGLVEVGAAMAAAPFLRGQVESHAQFDVLRNQLERLERRASPHLGITRSFCDNA